MAYTGKTISNQITGQSIHFLRTSKDTGGKWLEMEATYQPRSMEPLAHYHPQQEEEFTVLSGALTVKINGGHLVLQAGDHLHVPKNAVHSMWNASNGITIVNWKVRPAMNTEYFLETAMGLAGNKKTNSKGMPPLLQSALLASRFAPEFRLSKPPYFIQRFLFAILTPIGQRLGYKAVYPDSLD